MPSSKPAYAYHWQPISEQERAEKLAAFKKKNSQEVDCVKSVPDGVWMPKTFPQIAEQIYNFEARPTDIWVVTYPKCGTTVFSSTMHNGANLYIIQSLVYCSGLRK